MDQSSDFAERAEIMPAAPREDFGGERRSNPGERRSQFGFAPLAIALASPVPMGQKRTDL
jgi:hypothetical protein